MKSRDLSFTAAHRLLNSSHLISILLIQFGTGQRLIFQNLENLSNFYLRKLKIQTVQVLNFWQVVFKIVPLHCSPLTQLSSKLGLPRFLNAGSSMGRDRWPAYALPQTQKRIGLDGPMVKHVPCCTRPMVHLAQYAAYNSGWSGCFTERASNQVYLE